MSSFSHERRIGAAPVRAYRPVRAGDVGDLGMAACGFGGDFDISALWMLEALPQP
ncbi:hypothetical protein [Brevibacterium epidermidis]|uniref:Uncharacterized protein n=1 Tax=Brevibacterium epidermidis TaxID=1698 RepID=A0A9D2UMZ5_BREEP|nr:hypothetical protein [Brevibacterium epidermidis]HJE77902.1 hypothetical protein [Brevibacterium epidermidis]